MGEESLESDLVTFVGCRAEMKSVEWEEGVIAEREGSHRHE